MRRVVLREHERFYRGTGDVVSGTRQGGRLYLSDLHYRRLQHFDEHQSEHSLFAWRRGFGVSRQWVGVLQLPGLSIELLPKMAPPTTSASADETGFSRKNLLYMLQIAGALPLRERDLADQSLTSAPLLETLIGLFAEKLFIELGRGCQHNYLRRQENLPVLKGKLLFSTHLKQNLARQDRFFVEHDEFLPDTPLNRIFKAACRRLLDLTTVITTADRLRHCLLFLDRVATVRVRPQDFDNVVITRQNERFKELFDFARLVLLDESPTAAAGDTRTFSLLFDMNRVYEAFVAAFLSRFVLVGELADCRLFSQARGRLRHLVERDGKKVLPLKADLLIERGPDRLVIDTKWKRLSRDKGDRQGVAREDLFQLFAYAHNYEARHSLLLYPRPAGGADVQVFDVPRRHRDLAEQQIHARFIDLNRDLFRDRAHLTRELTAMLSTLLLAETQPQKSALAMDRQIVPT